MERRDLFALLWLVVCAHFLLAPGRVAAQVDDPRIRVPLDRYSISPFVEDSYLFLQGTTLPDLFKLDFSLGIKYMHQPWRLLEEGNPDFEESPVQDHVQFRPALSFAWRQWFDLALVVPFSAQTAGTADSLTTVTGQDGFHLLDPEVFVRVPLLHRRRQGLGLALGSQLFLPLGSSDAFVGLGAFQGNVLLAADWVHQNFSIMLNTGLLFRQRFESLNTTIGNEWFVRPGASYRIPIGAYALGFALEGNIATGLESFFSDRNVNAFQLLVSVQIGPASTTDGFYAAVGGGSRVQGGGYGVPVANVDSRIGYSLQWGERGWDEEGGGAAVAKPGEAPPPGETGERPGTQPEERVEVAEAVPDTEVPPPAEPFEVPAENMPDEPAPQEVARAGTMGPDTMVPGGGLVRVRFSSNAPATSGVASGSAGLPAGARRQVVARKRTLIEALRRPGAQLVVIGFADKCFIGPPPLGNQYNRELSQRRADAMVRLLREVLGPALRGIPVKTVAMGRRCANPACRCSQPDMPACADDRRVEIHVDAGSPAAYQCPGGGYWLAR